MNRKKGIRLTYEQVKELEKQGAHCLIDKLSELGFDIKRPINVEDHVSLGMYTYRQKD